MMSEFRKISIYKVGVLVAIVSWLMDVTGFSGRFLQTFPFAFGFFVVHGLLFAFFWLVIYFLERNFGIPLIVRSMRSRQGVALWLDGLVLIIVPLCWMASFGQRTLSDYQIGVGLLLLLAALQSFWFGHEPRRALAPIYPGRNTQPTISNREETFTQSGGPAPIVGDSLRVDGGSQDSAQSNDKTMPSSNGTS